MTGLGDLVVNTVAAMAATSLCYFGVTLKDDQVAKASRPQPAVVHRLPVQRSQNMKGWRAADVRPCPDEQKL
ncbi:MAG: hypothetical protein ACXW3D_11100 [Caulobacteraceae bacterium]